MNAHRNYVIGRLAHKETKLADTALFTNRISGEFLIKKRKRAFAASLCMECPRSLVF